MDGQACDKRESKVRHRKEVKLEILTDNNCTLKQSGSQSATKPFQFLSSAAVKQNEELTGIENSVRL